MKTFSVGGIHPRDNKITADSAIEDFTIPERVYILMNQHLGSPADPIVQKGDKVKVGQLIAKSSGFISANIHSSVSGTVLSVEPVKDIVGNFVMAVTIGVEGDDWCEEIDRDPRIIREIRHSKEEILERVKEAGIVGLGGAAFPTHVKLSPPPGKKAECLIVNGAECEPYLTADYRIMLEHTEEFLVGIRIMLKALGVEKAYLGIEVNKPVAIAQISSLLSEYPEIEVVSLAKKYPQGGEKQLIDAVISKKVPSMALPIDTGAIVQNCATVLAVYEAVQKNKPLFEGVMTVTGDCSSEQRNLRVRVGTSYHKIVDAVGGLPNEVVKVVSGGPMMGKAIANMDAPSVKASSAILLLTAEQTIREEEGNCIRCAKCVEVCPMGLEPYLLNKLARANRYKELEEDKVYDCIECGCCMFICPASISLLDYIRLAKSDVIKILRERSKK